jgi:hypothetical protein
MAKVDIALKAVDEIETVELQWLIPFSFQYFNQPVELFPVEMTE